MEENKASRLDITASVLVLSKEAMLLGTNELMGFDPDVETSDDALIRIFSVVLGCGIILHAECPKIMPDSR